MQVHVTQQLVQADAVAGRAVVRVAVQVEHDDALVVVVVVVVVVLGA